MKVVILPIAVGAGIALTIFLLTRRRRQPIVAPITEPAVATAPLTDTPPVDMGAARNAFRMEWGPLTDSQVRDKLTGKDATEILAYATSIGLSSSAVYDKIATIAAGNSYENIAFIDSDDEGAVV